VRHPLRDGALALVVAILVVSLLPVAGTHAAILPGVEKGASVAPAILGDPNPFVTGMAATLAIGAPNLDTYWSNANASAFVGATEYAKFDAQGNLWVTDYGGSRVVEFRPPFSTGEAASLVIGQSSVTGDQTGTTATNLSFPTSEAFDPAGDLWVADYGNNRILEYKPPFTSGMAASIAIGQSGFTSDTPGTTSSTLDLPQDVTFDPHGDLWVADFSNDRVLMFAPPFSTGMPATMVIGQTSFTTSASGTSPTTLHGPTDAFVSAAGDLWVADFGNNRVLEYPPPLASGAAAVVALGQSSLTTSTSTGENSFNGPVAVSADAQGNIWVSDGDHNRVLEFEPSFSTFETPALAIGQSSLTGVGPGRTATTLDNPYGVAFGGDGSLWVSDGANNRILEYVPQQFGLTMVPSGLPAGTAWSAVVGPARLAGIGSISGTLINGSYEANVVAPAGYRADPSYLPVTVSGAAQAVAVSFTTTSPNPFSMGMPASVVLGQPNFDTQFDISGVLTNASNLGGESYQGAFDVSGDLWIPDTNNNRVLEYLPPFTNGMAASRVLGQTSLEGFESGTSPVNLTSPEGVTFDAHGNLWIADYGNDRVEEFVPPFVTGMAASLVLGQPTFFTSATGLSASELNHPAGVSFDAHGDLWVADEENNRVLEFVPPFSNDMSASLVLGQSSFTTNGFSTTPTGEHAPLSVSVDSEGNVWVADFSNNRVLLYPAPLSIGEAATVALGETSLTTDLGAGPNGLNAPSCVDVIEGNVWVADVADNRVVEYLGPTFSTDEAAGLVLGQGNNSTYAGGLGRSGMSDPTGVFADHDGNIWVSDYGNNRVLGYIPTSYPLTYTETGLPSGTPWSVTVNDTAHASAAASVPLSVTNGTYSWSVAPVSGYTLTTASVGTSLVNGVGISVELLFGAYTYGATFTESALPAGTSWSVIVDGNTYTSTSTTVVAPLPNGTYSYTVPGVPGYAPVAAGGVVVVASAGTTASVAFAPFTYSVTFTETGLPAGTAWSVTVNGVAYTSTSATLVAPEPNGTFSYTVGALPNYSTTPSTGAGTVSAAPASEAVTFRSTSTSATPGGVPLLYALVASTVVLAALAAVLAMRRRKPPVSASPPAGWAPPQGSAAPPGTTGGPPPGAAGVPGGGSSPWSEGGPPPPSPP
jgi:sugar lactone lactonase YvrE